MLHPRQSLFELLEALTERRKAVGAVALTIVALALVALTQMPLQLLPEIRYPHVRIIGDLPGQTSRVVEESVNEPIEAALAGMSGLVQVASRSGDGRAYFELFFEPGYDMDRALRDVTQAVQRAQGQIPAEMPPLRIFEVTTTQQPALELAFGSPAMSAEELRARLRASVLPRLRALSGVDALFMGHQEIMELVVEVDPDSQAALGLHLDDLERLLWEATAPPLSSPMRTSHFEGVGVFGPDTWSAAHLQERMLLLNAGERAVPLTAVANVRRSPSQEGLRTRLDGHAAVLVTIYRSPRAHSTRLARDVQAVVEEVRALPSMATVDAHTLFDDSVVTRGAVQSVVLAAVGGAVLATLLLFVALRRQRRYVPLVATVVGVSLAAALVVLYAMGHSLNLLTLAGLLLSVGLGLDYAIIYFDRLDRIHHQHEKAHVQAMVDVAGPLLGALLTTLAAVLPFLLVQGMIAMLFRPLIWTVAVCGVFAFIFAVILLPVFTRPPAREETREAPAERTFPAWWRHAQHPLASWGMVVILGAIFLWGARGLPFEVLPVVDDGFVDMTISHPVGITVEAMDVMTRAVEAQLRQVEGTAALFTTVGGYFREGLPAFRPARSDFMVRVDTRGGALPSVEWARRARAAIAELGISELGVSITLPRIRGVQTRLADADVIVVLTREDGDLLALSEIEGLVESRLDEVDGLAGVQRVRGGVSPRWVAQPDYEALADYSVEPEALK